MTTTTIDCQTCPVRGRHCGDCFVPVLGRLWLDGPRPRPAVDGTTTDHDDGSETLVGVPLDSDELAAVSAFVRAGLVHPDEAARALAEVTAPGRYAAG